MTRACLLFLLLVQGSFAAAEHVTLTGPIPLPTGAWTIDGAPYAEFRGDGTCWVGQKTGKWKTDRKFKLLILSYGDGTREVMGYTLTGSSSAVTMTVTMNGQSKTLARGQMKAQGDDEFAALLMSTPWCDAIRDEISGKTRQERVRFRAGGLWTSGRAKTAKSGRWQTRGDRLWMSEGEALMKDAGTAVSRDATGYPVVRIGSKEYSQCR